jgi:hypothetical protein
MLAAPFFRFLVRRHSESCVLITIVRSPSNQKLVVSAAINQVLQNSLDRLMRVSITHPNYSYPYRDRGPLAAISIELVVAAICWQWAFCLFQYWHWGFLADTDTDTDTDTLILIL